MKDPSVHSGPSVFSALGTRGLPMQSLANDPTTACDNWLWPTYGLNVKENRAPEKGLSI